MNTKSTGYLALIVTPKLKIAMNAFFPARLAEI